jgi:hypothetical protein
MGEFLQHLGDQQVVQQECMKTPPDTANEKMPPHVEAFKTGGTEGVSVKPSVTAVDKVCKRVFTSMKDTTAPAHTAWHQTLHLWQQIRSPFFIDSTP